jgi:hypothetical protein
MDCDRWPRLTCREDPADWRLGFDFLLLLEPDAVGLNRRRHRSHNEPPTPSGRGADRAFMPTRYKA